MSRRIDLASIDADCTKLVNQVDESRSEISRFIINLGVESASADDVFQIVLKELHRECEKGMVIHNPMGLAMTIARHRAIDRKREEGRESRLHVPISNLGNVVAHPSGSNDDAGNVLNVALKVLSRDEYSVLELKLIYRTRKWSEIAQKVGISREEAQTLFDEALRKLREAWSG